MLAQTRKAQGILILKSHAILGLMRLNFRSVKSKPSWLLAKGRAGFMVFSGRELHTDAKISAMNQGPLRGAFFNKSASWSFHHLAWPVVP